VLQSTRHVSLGAAIVALVFLGAGLVLLRSGRPEGWFALALCVLNVMLSIVPLATRGSLTLTREGFTTQAGGRSFTYAWQDIQEFGVWTVGLWHVGMRWVGFRFNAAHPSSALWTRLGRVLSPWDGALPDTYGLQPQELVALLEHWRRGAYAEASCSR
jgi:hypothetical protein